MPNSVFSVPDPLLQVSFSQALTRARRDFLQEALQDAVAGSDLRTLDEEAHALAPALALRLLASRGLRAELVFALPSLLTLNPRLLAYYRLVLGFSQKEFYTRATGLAAYKRAEEGRGFPDCRSPAYRSSSPAA
jgi:hypothetical protein